MAAQTQHAIIPPVHNHTIVRWALATQAEFAALAGLIAGDIGKVAYVAETRVYHVLRNHDPISWDALNESATVSTAEYDATARTLTLTLSNGATIVATDVAVPEFPVADFALLDSAVTVTFATSAGPVATNSRVIDVPARSTVRINNFPVYDANVNWEPGDVCRQGSSAYYATVLTTGVFNPAHWREITDTAVTAYINTQLASRPRVYVFNAAPTAGDDSADGYAINDLWLDITAKKGYVATDVTVAAAVWNQFTPDIVVPWAEYNNGSDPTTAPEANFTDALALGNGAIAGATYAFAFLGNAGSSNSIAIGRNSAVTGAGGISIGQNSSATAGVAIGSNADSTQNHAIALGNNTLANGNAAIVIGNSITSAGICIGGTGAASGCLSIGGGSDSSGTFSTAIGSYLPKALGSCSTAVGSLANTQSKVGATCIGYMAYAADEGMIKLGAPCNDVGSFDGGLGCAGLSFVSRRVGIVNTNASRNVGSVGLERGKVYNIKVTVVAKQGGGDAVWSRSAQACFLYPNVGNTIQVGTQTDLFVAEDATFSGLTTLTLLAGTSTVVARISDSLTPSAEIGMEYVATFEITNSSSLAD